MNIVKGWWLSTIGWFRMLHGLIKLKKCNMIKSFTIPVPTQNGYRFSVLLNKPCGCVYVMGVFENTDNIIGKA